MEGVTAEGVAALVGSPRAVIVFSKTFDATWEVFPVAEQLVSGPALVLPHAAVESGESVAEALVAALNGKRVEESALDCAVPRAASARVAVVSVALRDGAKQAVARAMACAEAATGGRVAAVFVSEIVEPQVAVARQVRQTVAAPTVDGNGTLSEQRSTYFPSYVWAWLIIMFVLVFFALFALSSLSAVQVPPKLLSPEQAQHKKNK
jgi:hypothetical protein